MRIRFVRREYGISRRLLAEHLSISADQLNRYERGVVAIRVAPGWAFCELTKTNPYWLAFGEPHSRVALGRFGSIKSEEKAELFSHRMQRLRQGDRLNVDYSSVTPAPNFSGKIKLLAARGVKQYLSNMPVTPASNWEDLRSRLRAATAGRGAKSELARQLTVRASAVSQWLSGESLPTAENTLRLLEWVAAREARQQKKAPEVLKTRPAPKTRKGIESNEKPKSDPREA